MNDVAIGALTARAEGELPTMLRSLGYVVDWDFDRRGKWWEVCPDGRLVFQIDAWVTVSQLLADLPRLVELERHCTEEERAGAKWEFRCPSLADARELLRRIRCMDASKTSKEVGDAS